MHLHTHTHTQSVHKVSLRPVDLRKTRTVFVALYALVVFIHGPRMNRSLHTTLHTEQISESEAVKACLFVPMSSAKCIIFIFS